MSEEKVPVLGRMAYFAGKLQGVEAMLNNHLVECRERYQAYIQRHDDLSAQVAANDQHRTRQLNEVREDLGNALDKQTDRIWSMILRAVGGALVLMLATLGGLVGYLMKAHGWG